MYFFRVPGDRGPFLRLTRSVLSRPQKNQLFIPQKKASPQKAMLS